MSIHIDPNATMQALLSEFPSAKRALFARYHIGGCKSCSYADDESLSAVCERNELAVEEVVAHILESMEHDQKMLLEPSELKTWLDEGRQLVLLDARTREEFEEIPFQAKGVQAKFLNQEIQQALFAGPSETTIVIFDHTGSRVLDVCAWFRGHQMQNTYGLIGGLDRWAEEIDESVPRYKLEL